LAVWNQKYPRKRRDRTFVSPRPCAPAGGAIPDFTAEGQKGCFPEAAPAPRQTGKCLAAPSPFWSRDRHADRRARLIARSRILAELRIYFAAEGFVEVEPAILQVSPGNETHLHGFATEIVAPAGARSRAFLHTSPEFSMKKLIAAGEERIYAFSRVFRNRERGALHAPEFTMLEWYRAAEPYQRLMDDCATILQIAADATGAGYFAFRGREADPRAEPERLAVGQAFSRYAGVDLFASLSSDGRLQDRNRLAAQASTIDVRVAADDTWSDLFSRILVEKIEPNLGVGQPTILHSYPISEAALARPHRDDPRLAERFELYVCGVELANAFGELTDAAEQRRRFEADMAEKLRLYGEAYPIDEDFLAAVAEMPPASGAALGFDRLAMLACGAERIEDVQWTPVFEPATAALR
jgi:elongation factor P--(R)-beta-lysine ligase